MPIDAFALSDVGRVRSRNEDTFIAKSDLGLFAVADGMGGHASGDVASRTAIDQLTAATTISNDPTLLDKAVQLANLAVWERAQAEPGKEGMGTTMTAVLISEDARHAAIAHVGDSRCYLLRAGKLRQITTDHNLVPGSNILTRALGTQPSVDVDTANIDLQSDDLLVLCTDGLTGLVRDDDLQPMLLQEKPLQEIASNLVEAANLRGGTDNVTVVLVRLTA